MPLIQCPECKSEISSNAEVCPKCGQPMKRSSNKGSGNIFFIGWSILIILIIVVFLSVKHYQYQKEQAEWGGDPAQQMKKAMHQMYNR